MALKQQLKAVNDLGRKNLLEKGIELPETSTTYDIMKKIAEVSGGSDVISIVANEDGTLTCTNRKGEVDILTPHFDTNNKIISVDSSLNKRQYLATYENNNLKRLDSTSIDLSKIIYTFEKN